ncbi:MAG: hypothetical protein DWI27_08570, partial [Planctomycetota bacterium]
NDELKLIPTFPAVVGFVLNTAMSVEVGTVAPLQLAVLSQAPPVAEVVHVRSAAGASVAPSTAAIAATA